MISEAWLWLAQIVPTPVWGVQGLVIENAAAVQSVPPFLCPSVAPSVSCVQLLWDGASIVRGWHWRIRRAVVNRRCMLDVNLNVSQPSLLPALWGGGARVWSPWQVRQLRRSAGGISHTGTSVLAPFWHHITPLPPPATSELWWLWNRWNACDENT